MAEMMGHDFLDQFPCPPCDNPQTAGVRIQLLDREDRAVIEVGQPMDTVIPTSIPGETVREATLRAGREVGETLTKARMIRTEYVGNKPVTTSKDYYLPMTYYSLYSLVQAHETARQRRA